MYNCLNGSCNSNKLVTLLCNGIDPRHRTAKLQVVSSFATSVNIRSICFWTLLFTHSTPYSMMLAAVVVVVVIVVVLVTLTGFARWWYILADERFEFVPLPELSRILEPRWIFVDEPRLLILRMLLLRPQRTPLLPASRLLPAEDNRLERRRWLITGFISSSRWLTTDLRLKSIVLFNFRFTLEIISIDLPCIVKHGINFKFIDGVSANARHGVTMIVKQTKSRWIWATGCVASWSLHFFNRIKITGHHFFFLQRFHWIFIEL